MTQTAVEWLVKEIFPFGVEVKFKLDAIEQAKEMEKQQIIYAYIVADSESAQESEYHALNYYDRTYGSKGSDELSKVAKDTSFDNSSQTEISDEEIEKAAKFYNDNQSSYETTIAHFMEGAIWYREQLKNKQ